MIVIIRFGIRIVFIMVTFIAKICFLVAFYHSKNLYYDIAKQ